MSERETQSDRPSTSHEERAKPKTICLLVHKWQGHRAKRDEEHTFNEFEKVARVAFIRRLLVYITNSYECKVHLYCQWQATT